MHEELFYPILCIAVSCANDASGFLHHLEDDAAVDVAHNVGVVWTHEPTGQEKVCFSVLAWKCSLLGFRDIWHRFPVFMALF